MQRAQQAEAASAAAKDMLCSQDKEIKRLQADLQEYEVYMSELCRPTDTEALSPGSAAHEARC
jgi:hypothetical protein